MKVYSSSEAPTFFNSARLYALNTASFSVEADPIDTDRYRASARVAHLGPLTVSRIHSNAAIVHRKKESPSRRHGRRYSFTVVTRGQLIVTHHQGTSELSDGDVLLLDNAFPRTLFVYHQVSLTVINVPESVLTRHLSKPEEYAGQHTAAGAGQAEESLSAAAMTVWHQLEQGLLQADDTQAADALLNTIVQQYCSATTPAHPRLTRRMKEVRELIERNLDNPELSVEMLAKRLRISSRHLRSLFASGERISHYILRRRLEECANQLANSLYRNMSITAIAYQWGFASPAHFSRVFKRQYGCTPREFRRKQLEARMAEEKVEDNDGEDIDPDLLTST